MRRRSAASFEEDRTDVTAPLQTLAGALAATTVDSVVHRVGDDMGEDGNHMASHEQVLRDVFACLDKNGNGLLEREEILDGLMRSHPVRLLASTVRPLRALLIPKLWQRTFDTVPGGIDADMFLHFCRVVLDEQVPLAQCFELARMGVRGRVTGGAESFRDMDTHGAGPAVTKLQLLQALRYNEKVRGIVGSNPRLTGLLRPASFARTFMTLDTDESGSVSLDEWYAFALGALQPVTGIVPPPNAPLAGEGEEKGEGKGEGKSEGNGEPSATSLPPHVITAEIGSSSASNTAPQPPLVMTPSSVREARRTEDAKFLDMDRRATLRQLFEVLDCNASGSILVSDLAHGVLDSTRCVALIAAAPALRPLTMPHIWRRALNAMETVRCVLLCSSV
jgi:Ca2+-binding EF-hand superfamily protein